ncbi:hypothetical protein ILUMI_04549 [Ignelater luminosus]|uniref:Transposase n=1 Tax=Ignelater luminosus TaxID=2038154 RepID=A0A8K0DDN6_IGNLU|nr:hypothetical protein ILUMI_04549 [Ignelater luminosus]
MQTIWFQQDGCPTHNTRDVQHFLRENFNEIVLSNNGPVQWPARSTDLTPLDLYLRGTPKNEVFDFEPPETREILEQRVLDVLRSLNRTTLREVSQSIELRSAALFLMEEGRSKRLPVLPTTSIQTSKTAAQVAEHSSQTSWNPGSKPNGHKS